MKLTKLMMSTALATLLAGGALAQDTDMTATDETATDMAVAPTFTSVDEMTVGDMLSMRVYDPNGDLIGDIDYVIQGATGGEAVIGIGGFIGLGEYTVAIPLENFELGAEGSSLTLDTDKETLEQRPEFDESGAESLPDETPLATLLPQDDMDTDMDADTDGDLNSDAVDSITDESDMSDEGAMDDGMAEEDMSDDTMSDDTMTDDGMADDGAATEGDMSTDTDTEADTTTQ